jgi:hypothetical protein
MVSPDGKRRVAEGAIDERPKPTVSIASPTRGKTRKAEAADLPRDDLPPMSQDA